MSIYQCSTCSDKWALHDPPTSDQIVMLVEHQNRKHGALAEAQREIDFWKDDRRKAWDKVKEAQEEIDKLKAMLQDVRTELAAKQ